MLKSSEARGASPRRQAAEVRQADDPGALIRRSLSAPPGALAEDTLLAWLLSLPLGRDPALAARSLLRLYDGGGAPLAGEASRLLGLLRQTAAYPRDRLERHFTGRRRRHSGEIMP